MNKTILLVALGFAAASANFLEFERNLQGAVTASLAACTKNTTAEVCGAGYCCATIVKNSVNQTASACVPTDFVGQLFVVGGANHTFSCNFPTTATNYNNVAACDATNATACATGFCCATKSWSFAGATGSLTKKTCINSTVAAAGPLLSASYTNATVLSNLTAQVSAACPTASGSSFSVAMKASMMVVLAVISALLF